MDPIEQNRASAGTDTGPAIYRVTYENREIRVNGRRLSKPNFDSENEIVFDFIFRNPNRKILLTEIEASIGRPVVKKLYDVVRSLGFRKDLKAMFFPHIAKTAITFINPVVTSDTAEVLTAMGKRREMTLGRNNS